MLDVERLLRRHRPEIQQHLSEWLGDEEEAARCGREFPNRLSIRPIGCLRFWNSRASRAVRRHRGTEPLRTGEDIVEFFRETTGYQPRGACPARREVASARKRSRSA